MRAPRRTARDRLAWMLVAMLLAPEAAVAQLIPWLPISVELRTGAALPIGDFGEENPGLGAGMGLGAAVALHVQPVSYLAVYGSYDYARFGCGQCGAVGLEGRLPEAGFEVGLEGNPLWRLWVNAGALLGRRLEIPDGGDGFTSDAAAGWSVGAGLRLPVGSSLRLLPAIRYRSYAAEFEFPDLNFDFGGGGVLERELQVSSVALEVGLSYEL